jgi:hypothetical protein
VTGKEGLDQGYEGLIKHGTGVSDLGGKEKGCCGRDGKTESDYLW